MQAITLRIDDETFQLLHEIAQEDDNKPVDEIMIESLRCYLEIIRKKKLQQQIKNASLLVREQSLEWVKATTDISLEELLAGSPKEAFALTDEDREWLDFPAVGKEIL